MRVAHCCFRRHTNSERQWSGHAVCICRDLSMCDTKYVQINLEHTERVRAESRWIRSRNSKMENYENTQIALELSVACCGSVCERALARHYYLCAQKQIEFYRIEIEVHSTVHTYAVAHINHVHINGIAAYQLRFKGLCSRRKNCNIAN